MFRPSQERMRRGWLKGCGVCKRGQALSSHVSPSPSYKVPEMLPRTGVARRRSGSGGGRPSGRWGMRLPLQSGRKSACPCCRCSECAFPAVPAEVNSEPVSQESHQFICFVRFWVYAHLKWEGTIWQKRTFQAENMLFILKQL